MRLKHKSDQVTALPRTPAVAFHLTQSKSLSLHNGLQHSTRADSPSASLTHPLLLCPRADSAPVTLAFLPNHPRHMHTRVCTHAHARSPGRPFVFAIPSASMRFPQISTQITPSFPLGLYSSYLDTETSLMILFKIGTTAQHSIPLPWLYFSLQYLSLTYIFYKSSLYCLAPLVCTFTRVNFSCLLSLLLYSQHGELTFNLIKFW